ncbi:low molecular weight phosphatase family protein [Rubripirellula reticaptiva]|uniref:Protein ArsC n=1 Tax=Rubripirellula reticaptiva TaxID=2528013 RepID=A0A5C6FDY4_9BACT|nr:protein-tyrosine-phosphatase [Rubripirellula reticaptiva]TWU57771.1 Protein ArsC [Rubripirellula reticaptiva]
MRFYPLVWILAISVAVSTNLIASEPVKLNEPLADYTKQRQSEFDQIPVSRRSELAELADQVRDAIAAGGQVNLHFICTHNSRRSHLAQIWATVAAADRGIEGVNTFSGGTEATAMNVRIVAALGRAGFDVATAASDVPNPRYDVRYSHAASPIVCFSKVYDQSPNPSAGYCAVMVCSDADANCPVVRGAATRLVIKYVDPKESDGTPQESDTYDERCAQVAREMLYAFSLLS